MTTHISPTTKDSTSDSRSPQQIKRLSSPAKILCYVALPPTLATLLALSPLTAALLPILLLPTIWLFWKWNTGTSADPEAMIWLYFATGTIGILAVVVLESILSYGFAILLFGSDTQMYLEAWTQQENDRRNHIDVSGTEIEKTRQDMVSRWQYLLFLVLTSYISMAMVEEGLKYSSLLILRRFSPVVHESEYITYAIASGLGFSTVESLAFIYETCRSESGRQIAIAVFHRVFLAAPGHAMTSCLLAINVIRRDLRKEQLGLWQVVRLPVLLHGTFDFVLFVISAVNGNIGWVLPEKGISLVLVVVVAIGTPMATFVILRQKIRKYGIRL